MERGKKKYEPDGWIYRMKYIIKFKNKGMRELSKIRGKDKRKKRSQI